MVSRARSDRPSNHAARRPPAPACRKRWPSSFDGRPSGPTQDEDPGDLEACARHTLSAITVALQRYPHGQALAAALSVGVHQHAA